MNSSSLGLSMVVDAEIPPPPDPVMARIYGEPIQQLPLDLYIPPDALEVMLDAFEGPLDLLLYLIRRANIDILDIPMAPLTAQYLEYVEVMRAKNLELAGEYLLMAAMLIEIKSRMLLPRPKQADSSEESEDPRAELVRRLIEYEQIKLAARRLDEIPQAGRDFEWTYVLTDQTVVERLPEVSIDDLRRAWTVILRQARLKQHHHIGREELSVREHMGAILRRLRDLVAAGGEFLEFTQLFVQERSVRMVVVHFIAMLELAREKMIGLTQSEPFAPIYVRLSNADA